MNKTPEFSANVFPCGQTATKDGIEEFIAGLTPLQKRQLDLANKLGLPAPKFPGPLEKRMQRNAFEIQQESALKGLQKRLAKAKI